MRHRVMVRHGHSIEAPVITTRSPPPRCFQDHMERGGPLAVGPADNDHVSHQLEFILGDAQLVRWQAVHPSMHWGALGGDVVYDPVSGSRPAGNKSGWATFATNFHLYERESKVRARVRIQYVRMSLPLMAERTGPFLPARVSRPIGGRMLTITSGSSIRQMETVLNVDVLNRVLIEND